MRSLLSRVWIIAMVLCSSAAGADEIRRIPLPTHAIVYDRVAQRIYASVPGSANGSGDSIAVVDPRGGAVERAVAAGTGSDPGQLALSGDGRYLYAALDGFSTVRRLELPALTPGLQFSLGSEPGVGPYTAEDMAVLPGSPESIAVSRRISSSIRGRVAIYDNGVARPSQAEGQRGSNRIEFSAGAERLYGLDNSILRGGLHRMAVSSAGITVLDSSPWLALGADMEYDAGRLYTTGGRVIDPEGPTLLGTFPIGGSEEAEEILVEPDSAAGRVFFLTGEGPTRVLRAFDSRTFLPLGSLAVADISGRASSLIRWGEDGLAFRTDAGQLFLIRTRLVRALGPAADLSVSQSAAPDPVLVGSSLTYTLTVANRGPDPATGVTLVDEAPSGATLLSVTASQGSFAQSGGKVTVALGSLAAGAGATVTLTVRPTAAGTRVNSARVTAAEPDPDEGNNAAAYAATATLTAGPHVIRQIRLATNDLAYDRTTRKIYASVPSSAGATGNSITAVDPLTGAIGPSVWVGSEPGKLALSDDGRYLYVSLDGAAAVRRLELPTASAGLQFSLGSDPREGPLFPVDLAVAPSEPETVAVARGVFRSSQRGLVAIYDNGVPRPRMTSDSQRSPVIVYSGSSSRLYGMDNTTTDFLFHRMSVDRSGITVLDSTPHLVTGFGVEMRYEEGRIYTTAGQVIDPETRTLLGDFPGVRHPSLVLPDAANGRVYFLLGSGESRLLQVYDLRTRAQIGALMIPGIAGETSSLIRWGEDGLAFRTSTGQLFLVRTPLVRPAVPSADVWVAQFASPDPVAVGSELTYTITVTNQGPDPAMGVTLTDTLPAAARFVSAAASQGSSAQSGGTVTASLGALLAGASATVTIVVQPNAAGQLTNTVRVGAAEPDPNPGNNVTAQAATVAPAPGPDLIRQIRLPTRDLVYDRATRRIYASVPGDAGEIANSITTVDPEMGTVERSVAIGSEPGKLALSDDGVALYAALDGVPAVRRFDVPSQTAGLQFSLGGNERFGAYAAADIEVLPGRPESIAVVRQNRGVDPGGYGGVAIFDDGVPRPEITQGLERADTIAFSNVASRLYGFSLGYSPWFFRRMAVGPTGVSVVQSAPMPSPGEGMQFEGGRVYTTSGLVIDPEAPALLGTFPLDRSRHLMAPDAALGRVFFLTGEGETRTLQAFDTQTFRLAGSLAVPGVVGRASSLIRWGEDGLAFRTDAGQLFLIRTRLVRASGPAADLAVSQTAAPDPIVVGAGLTYTVTVANQGPDPATRVILTLSLSPGAAVQSVSVSQGSFSQTAGGVEVALGTLASGARALVTLVVRPAAAGALTATARVSAAEPDPNDDNNLATQVTTVTAAVGPHVVRQLPLPANDLVYSRATGRIYASVPGAAGGIGNTVTAVDPESASVGPSIWVGSEPGKLALAGDEQTLYAGLDGAGAVRRVDVRAGTAGIQFPLSADPAAGAYVVDEMEVLPGNPSAVVIARRNTGFEFPNGSIAFYLDGAQRGDATEDAPGCPMIAVTNSRLYVFDRASSFHWLQRMSVDASGVSVIDVVPLTFLGREMQLDDGLLFTASGRVVDPELPGLAGTFPIDPSDNLVVSDAAIGRVFFLAGRGSTRALLAFDRRTFLPVGSLMISGVSGEASSLIRWGEDGLAFRTSAGQLFLIRSPLVHTTAPSADLSVTQADAIDPIAPGDDLTDTITVTNYGPDPATGVTLAVPLTAGGSLVSVTASQGSAAPSGGSLVAQLGTLRPGERATVTLVLRPSAVGTLLTAARVSANETDFDPSNNEAVEKSTVSAAPVPDVVEEVRLITQDLVYDRATGWLFASVPGRAGSGGNSITPIEPVTGAVGPSVWVGSEPGKLALSDDRRYLYVVLDGAAAVRQLDLRSGKPSLQFGLGSELQSGLFFADDLAVVPGMAESVAVARRDGLLQQQGVAVYDNGVQRPAVALDRGGQINVIAFGSSPTRLYGYNNRNTEFGFRRMTVDASGVSIQDVASNLITGYDADIVYDGGRIYSSSGRVIDPEARTLLGTFPQIGEGAADGPLPLVAPDSAAGRVFFLMGDGPARALTAYDAQTFLPLGSLTIPGVSGRAGSLLRWGRDGLAFRTEGGQVFLIRTALAR